jgi:hypothetical protein
MRAALLALALVMGASVAADPAKPAAPPLEFALVGDGKPARLEVRASVDGTPVPAVWNDTFGKLHAYFDRDGNGTLDEKEAARLPAARAFRQAMGNGFTPPVGTAPAFSELDRNGDGKVTADELAAHYRASGVGGVYVGVGRLPAGAELTAALLKQFATDRDGKVGEKDWKAGIEALNKLDKNDDELIGAGELVPKALYPGAAGTLLLSPPAADSRPPDVLAKLPLVRLPAETGDTHWAKELAKRAPQVTADELAGWRTKDADARWEVKFATKPTEHERFTLAAGGVRVDGWATGGRMDDAVATVRQQLTAQLDGKTDPEPPTGGGRRRAGSGLDWLVPVADRDGDGKLSAKELDGWLDLQVQIARGQVLLTVLDGGGLFEVLDANHDGALSVRELRGGWERLKAAGAVADGKFDPKTLPRVVLIAASRGYTSTLAVDARCGPDWFRAMDRNGDGDVSRREFTGPPEVFAELDADQDGLIDATEAERSRLKK